MLAKEGSDCQGSPRQLFHHINEDLKSIILQLFGPFSKLDMLYDLSHDNSHLFYSINGPIDHHFAVLFLFFPAVSSCS